MKNMLVVYIPCKDKEEAARISMALLEKKLIACANVISATSMYWWQGSIEQGAEEIIVAKTLDEKYEALEQEVTSMHSYDCPCVLAFPVAHVNAAYKESIENSIRD